MKPFFSIIIATFNRPRKIIRAIESVLTQSFTDFELIIVNDGSTNDYSEVEDYINNFPSKIRYYYKINEERSVARNYGINKAKGEFICFLDDDDYYLDHHLQTLYYEIEKQRFRKGFYHTYCYRIDRNHVKIKAQIIPRNPVYSILEYYLTDGVMTMINTCGSKRSIYSIPF